jgi:hypothetical protein
MCTCLMHICQAGPQGGSCSRTSSGTATAEGRIRVPEGNRGVIGRFTAVIRRSVPRRAPAVEDSGWCGLSSRARRSTTLRLMVPGPRRAGRSPICRRAPSPCPRLPCCRKIAAPIGRRASASGSSWAKSWNRRLGWGGVRSRDRLVSDSWHSGSIGQLTPSCGTQRDVFDGGWWPLRDVLLDVPSQSRRRRCLGRRVQRGRPTPLARDARADGAAPYT